MNESNQHGWAPPRRIEAVVFDWAGTTIDHGSCAPMKVFVELFRRHGVAITVAQARGPMGMAKRAHIAALLDVPAIAHAWRDAHHGDPPTERDIDTLYGEFAPLQLKTLRDHCTLIDGVTGVVRQLRDRGVKIGSTTGYTTPIMSVVTAEAARQGFEPDLMLCASDVEVGRPAPWLLFETARRLNVYPMSAIVKVDDTVTGVEAGRNAGCWTVGVSRTGNLVGLTVAELAALDDADRAPRIAAAAHELRAAGAHFVVESVADLMPVIAEIERRLVAGERP